VVFPPTEEILPCSPRFLDTHPHTLLAMLAQLRLLISARRRGLVKWNSPRDDGSVSFRRCTAWNSLELGIFFSVLKSSVDEESVEVLGI
jgi:hypothetical protein